MRLKEYGCQTLSQVLKEGGMGWKGGPGIEYCLHEPPTTCVPLTVWLIDLLRSLEVSVNRRDTTDWEGVCVRAKSIQSCLTLCDPIDYNLPGSSVHGISQAKILEWVAMPCSRGPSQPRDQTQVSCIAGRFLLLEVY